MGAQIMLNRTPFGFNPFLTEGDRPPNGDTSEVTTTTTTTTPTTTTTTMEPTTTADPREAFGPWMLDTDKIIQYQIRFSVIVDTFEDCRSHALVAKSKYQFIFCLIVTYVCPSQFETTG